MIKLFKLISLILILLLGIRFLAERSDLLKDSGFQLNDLKSNAEIMIQTGQNLISKSHLNLSEIMTYSIILIGVLYVALHFIELIAKGIARLFNRDHTSHQSKHKVGKIFLGAVFIKLALIILQLILLITQAWSLSRFFHYLIDKPKDFWTIVSQDVIFFAVLLLLLFFKSIGTKTNPEREVFHTT